MIVLFNRCEKDRTCIVKIYIFLNECNVTIFTYTEYKNCLLISLYKSKIWNYDAESSNSGWVNIFYNKVLY